MNPDLNLNNRLKRMSSPDIFGDTKTTNNEKSPALVILSGSCKR